MSPIKEKDHHEEVEAETISPMDVSIINKNKDSKEEIMTDTEENSLQDTLERSNNTEEGDLIQVLEEKTLLKGMKKEDHTTIIDIPITDTKIKNIKKTNM